MAEEEQEVQAAPPPSSFGEEMRKEREIRGISLKEIADATKISKRYLEAIERDNYVALPAPVFTRGFVREYARYLGLNPDEAVDRYVHFRQSLEEMGAAPKPPKPPARDVAHEPLREMRQETARESLRKIQSGDESQTRRRGYRGLLLFFVLLALFLVAAWGVYELLSWRRQPAQPPGTTNESVARVLIGEPSQPSPPPQEELVMRIRARENSWLELEADGRDVFNSEMRQGEEQTFRARQRFLFKTIGNARGIDVELNGVPLPSLAERGRVVRNRVIDRESIQP